MGYYFMAMFHYIVAAFVGLIIFVKFGAMPTWVFVGIFLAYKIYESLRYLSKGKSDVVLDAQGNLEQWTFVGAVFTISVDMKALTFHISAPGAEIVDTSSILVSEWKTVKKRIDTSFPLCSVSISTNKAMRNKVVVHHSQAMGYRQDGSYGLGIRPSHVSSTMVTTGGHELIIFIGKGSVESLRTESGLCNKWVPDRNGRNDKQIYLKDAVSARQIKNFNQGWDLVQAALKARKC